MALPLYDEFNYTLTRESPETRGEFQDAADGRVTVGWDILSPPAGPDGVPYQLIFVGPTSEHRGCAVRLSLVTRDGVQAPDDAEVMLETYYRTGEERTVLFQGIYKDFKSAPDQRAAEAAVSIQKRAEAGEDYVIRLGVSIPEGGQVLDPEADDSYFELECVKLWWNETA